MTLLGAWARCDWIISGHMGPPFVLAWNEFAVRTPEEAEKRLQDRVVEIELALAGLDQGTQKRNREPLERWLALPQHKVVRGRGEEVPAWYVNMWSVNLPDAATGFAVLDLDGEPAGCITGHPAKP